MTQKEIKRLKKRVVEETALNVGFYYSILTKIVELVPDMFEELLLETDIANLAGEPDFNNALITESVRKLKYSEFKEVVPYFIGYETYK